MEIKLNYGTSGLDIDLPDDWDIRTIVKPGMPVLDDPAASLEEALERPIQARRLEDEAKGATSACILICDITRPVPNKTILPVLIRRLLAAGLAADEITVLVATGLHRPNLGTELAELIGDDWVLNTVEVVNHFARRDGDHLELGRTESGLPIALDRRFALADLKIVTGLVEPHFMAGYSGGRKVIVPGVTHHETIRAIHTTDFLEHPAAANCVLRDNPLHEIQLEMVAKLGRVLAVNAVIDDQRRPSLFNYGLLEPSHLAAVEFMSRFAEVGLDRQYRTVITSGAGYPLDATYYQTVKGMVGGLDALAPGGRLFIASECSLGIGSVEYAEAQRKLIELGVAGFLESLAGKEMAEIDEWQTEMQLKPMRRGGISLKCKGLSAGEIALTGVEVIQDLNSAVRDWVARIGDTSVAVIPEGPYVIPRFIEV